MIRILGLVLLLLPVGWVLGGPIHARWILASPHLREGGVMNEAFTCPEGSSPRLTWSRPPRGTKSLAIILEKVSPRGESRLYWILYNIPVAARTLYASVAAARVTTDQMRQCRNDFGQLGYQGPCGRREVGRYRFRILALDQPLKLVGGANAQSFRKAVTGHRLGHADLNVEYKP